MSFFVDMVGLNKFSLDIKELTDRTLAARHEAVSNLPSR